jgi:hypothetical protein
MALESVEGRVHRYHATPLSSDGERRRKAFLADFQTRHQQVIHAARMRHAGALQALRDDLRGEAMHSASASSTSSESVRCVSSHSSGEASAAERAADEVDIDEFIERCLRDLELDMIENERVACDAAERALRLESAELQYLAWLTDGPAKRSPESAASSSSSSSTAEASVPAGMPLVGPCPLCFRSGHLYDVREVVVCRADGCSFRFDTRGGIPPRELHRLLRESHACHCCVNPLCKSVPVASVSKHAGRELLELTCFGCGWKDVVA